MSSEMPAEVRHEAMKQRFPDLIGEKTRLLLLGDYLYLRDGDTWVLLPN